MGTLGLLQHLPHRFGICSCLFRKGLGWKGVQHYAELSVLGAKSIIDFICYE